MFTITTQITKITTTPKITNKKGFQIICNKLLLNTCSFNPENIYFHPFVNSQNIKYKNKITEPVNIKFTLSQ
jgi:hypothetical protein